jgi:hypothetical protein
LFNHITINEHIENSVKSKNSYLVYLEKLKTYFCKKINKGIVYKNNSLELQKTNFRKEKDFNSGMINLSETNFTSDVLHKSHIKNFFSFNYNSMYDSYNNSTNNSTSKTSNNTPYFHKSQTFTNQQVSEFNFTKEINTEKAQQLQNTKKKQKPLNEKKPIKTQGSSNLINPSAKPKYQLKFTSFEIDADDLNAINEFADIDPKYLTKSEYEKLDYFVNMEINQDNVKNIFDAEFNSEEDYQIIKEHCDNQKISNEYVEDCLMMFNNSKKKKEGKLSKLKESDILVFDVAEKQFYKKIKTSEDVKLTKVSKENVNGVIQNNINYDQDESLVKVNVTIFPVNIYEDHVI